MKLTVRLVAAHLALLVALSWSLAGAVALEASGSPCRPVTHEGLGYVVCTVDLRRDDVRLYWKRADGEPFGSFERFLASRPKNSVVMAVNGGMYAPDLSPVGLYVEDGRQLKGANNANGEGNFHLKPNGVFLVSGRHAAVMETGEYLRRRPHADFATQSGPMLVIDGRIHPKFSEEGPSRKIRNGVGVRDPDTVLFAISDEPVSFGAFARLFRDVLVCANALFLDGTISSLYAPMLGRADARYPMGPIIAVETRAAP